MSSSIVGWLPLIIPAALAVIAVRFISRQIRSEREFLWRSWKFLCLLLMAPMFFSHLLGIQLSNDVQVLFLIIGGVGIIMYLAYRFAIVWSKDHGGLANVEWSIYSETYKKRLIDFSVVLLTASFTALACASSKGLGALIAILLVIPGIFLMIYFRRSAKIELPHLWYHWIFLLLIFGATLLFLNFLVWSSMCSVHKICPA